MPNTHNAGKIAKWTKSKLSLTGRECRVQKYTVYCYSPLCWTLDYVGDLGGKEKKNAHVLLGFLDNNRQCVNCSVIAACGL